MVRGRRPIPRGLVDGADQCGGSKQKAGPHFAAPKGGGGSLRQRALWVGEILGGEGDGECEMKSGEAEGRRKHLKGHSRMRRSTGEAPQEQPFAQAPREGKLTHRDEISVVGGPYAVVQPLAVMVEAVNALVAVSKEEGEE